MSSEKTGKQQAPGLDQSSPEISSAIAGEVHQAVLQHQRGNLAEAERLYRRALAQAPEHFDALHMLGVLRHQQGQHEEAVDLIRKAILSKPDVPAAWINLGVALQRLGRCEDALESYDRALALKPDYANALVNRGNAYQELRRHLEALASYDRALSLEPNHVEALFNRANTLQDLNRHAEALADYEQVLALRPDHPKALLNRGIALLDLERYEEALASFESALKLKADYAEAFNNCAVAQQALGRYEEALASANRALALRPDYAGALSNLHGCHLRVCKWETLAHDADAMIAAVRRGENAVTPFVLLATTDSARDQQQCARTYIADRYPAFPTPMWVGQRRAHDKIRVAYLSADFREHAVSYLMAGLFEMHDREQFETMAISFSPKFHNEMGERVRAAFGQFVEAFDRSNRTVAELMFELNVDIAVDLMGFTQHSRTAILSHRPAPIQVNYLGFPGTMGAEYIDYIIADDFVIPREAQGWYTEKVVYLPDTFQVNDARRKRPGKVPTRSEVGLPESGFVFCSFNGHYKITPRMFDVWMRLLEQIPGSVLWLVLGNVSAQDNLRREAANRGIEPRRLIFAPELGYGDHLTRLQLGELFLDTLPYNAGTTASDALWAGVPVVTCAGEAFASRMAGSLLNAVGLPELITQNLDDYEALALQLAREPAVLSEIRAKLARNRSACSLFDTDRFRRHIEQAYTMMWERHQRGEKPASIVIRKIA